jgi:hypothetical protein
MEQRLPEPDASSGPIVEFVAAPMFVGHETVTHIVAHDPAGVTRVELYLDDMRVSAVEFAPFDAVWDASNFAPGRHTLRALAYTSDGRTGDTKTQISIDHVQPRVRVPSAATRDQSFVIDAADDEAGVDQVAVRRGSTTLATLTTPPYQLAWPGGVCGPIELTVVVTDHVGNQATSVGIVNATDTQDLDCDGDAAVAFGGRDCDDSNAAFGPHAADSGTILADFNCDGVPGVDADHDEVPSLATGGTDCDDTTSAVHGEWLGWRGKQLKLTDPHSTTFFAMDDFSDDVGFAFIDNDTGNLFAAQTIAANVISSFQLQAVLVADHADPEVDRHPTVVWLHNGGIAIAFFADTALKVAIRPLGALSWTVTEVDPGIGPRLRRVSAVDDENGALHLVYEAPGGSPSLLRYATNRGGTWSTQTLPEGQDSLQSAQIAVDLAGVPHIIYESTTEVRHMAFNGASWVSNTVFADRNRISLYTIGLDDLLILSVVAVVRGTDRDELRKGFNFNGFALESSGFVFVPELITGLNLNRGDIVLQLRNRSSGATAVMAMNASGAKQSLSVDRIVGSTRSTSGSLRVVLAPPGGPLLLAGLNRFVAGPTDPSGGPDLNCNGVP